MKTTLITSILLNAVLAAFALPGDTRFALAKMNPGGNLAFGFGSLGRKIVDFPETEARINALGFYLNDRVVAAGKTWNGSAFDFAIARFQNELIPTAATAAVSGRVTTADGRGIRNAIVTITDKGGLDRAATTATFGYIRFDSVPVGGHTLLRSNQAFGVRFAVPDRNRRSGSERS